MFELTKPQKLIYNTEKFSGGAIATICSSMLYMGTADDALLCSAANELYRINDTLRTRIKDTDHGAKQYTEEYTEQNISVLTFEEKKELDLYAQKLAEEAMDMYGRLCDIRVIKLKNQYGILVKLHHIIGDAWTMSLIARQFDMLLHGQTPVSYPYADYIHSENEYVQGNRYSKDKEFFTEQFKACDEAVYLSEKQTDSVMSQRKTVELSKDITKKLADYTAARNSSIFALFMTAVSVYISRIKMNAEKFYIGTPMLNRQGLKEQNTLGMFINTVPVLARVNSERSFNETLQAMTDTAMAVMRHQRFNYEDILTELRKEYGFSEKLYDVVVSYQNAKTNVSAAKTEWYHCGMQTESLQIHIDDRDNEGILKIHYDYQTEKFTENDIARMHEHLFNLLLDAVNDDAKKIYKLEMLSKNEKEKLLYAFNDTKADYPKEKCIHQLFEEQVKKNPQKTALVACDKTLTYDELNRLSNRIAHSLIEKGVKRNDIVAFALPRKSYLIAAMFGILKSGAAYMPIDPDYPQDRIDYMLKDSNAKMSITKDNIREFISNNDENPNVIMSSTDLCYCIYTSGSTGKPKGTLLYHKGINNLVTNLKIYKNISKCNMFGFLTTITFDVATQEIFTALVNGFSGYLMPERSKTAINTVLDKIEKNKIDIVYATPSYFNALTETYDNASVLLKALKVVVLAGEKFYLNKNVVCLKKKYNTIFENQYGPVELHVIATTKCMNENDFLSIGKPIGNDKAYIIDRYNNPMPIGIVGELCIAGDGVGAGYLNRPELTAEKFINNPFGEGKLYKTGDLAYWREDGNIAYVGRNDFQVKIRGLRIELGEIENAICSVSGVSQAVVTVRRDENGRQFICAFYTEKQPVDIAEIKSVILSKLPKYMLPHIFTKLENMPLTASGKINRKALPEVDLHDISNDTEYKAPQTEAEKLLTDEIQDILNIENVGVLDNFFDLGGDSLKAIELLSKLEVKGYAVSVKDIFDSGNIEKLAGKLEKKQISDNSNAYTDDIPATDAQMRIYTAQSMNENSTTYNVPFVFRVSSLDCGRLQNAIDKLLKRHEILRTYFENRDGKIIQIKDDNAVCRVKKLESGNAEDFIRPFDPAQAPLIRVGYYENTVMIDMHHIITDGGSMPVIINELNEMYMDRELSGSPVQYKEFACQHRDFGQSENYWLNVYDDDIPSLEINTDFKRGQKQTFNGNAVYDAISEELHNKICKKCKTLNVTPFVFYMSAFNILLSKFSGCEDIIVGMPISGRESKFLDTIGMFVNTVALRNKPVGTKLVSEFLSEVKENSVNAIANQSYPFGELVKRLNIDTQNRNPLFDVMFAYQSEEMTDVVFGDEKAELLPVPITTSKYDFTFNIMPREKDSVIMAEYCTDLYKEETIKRFIDGYKKILRTMLNENTYIYDISAVSEEEEHRLLYEFNDTKTEYPKDKCVHRFFEEQALAAPDKTAVIACDKTLTYDELNRLSNRIAHSLIEKGIQKGDIVAFALPRRSYLIAVMFGILKSGAAYIPIDPDYPQDRIDYMLKDSGAKIFITEDNIYEFLQNKNEENPNVLILSNDLCYCIYTSGSTGKPKGSLLYHRNLINFCTVNNANNLQNFIFTNCKTILAFGAIVFDISIFEIVLSLLLNKTIIFANETQITNTHILADVIENNKVDCIHITPSKLELYLLDYAFKKALSKVKCMMIGGEKLSNRLLDKLQNMGINIFNGYGPTETTLGVCFGEIK